MNLVRSDEGQLVVIPGDPAIREPRSCGRILARIGRRARKSLCKLKPKADLLRIGEGDPSQ
jgi:hypothetical protein